VLWPCQKHAASPLQSYGARNGTSHSARNSCLSDQSPAHENASRQAVYGPGVAAQVNSFLTRALGIPKRTLGSLRTRKMLATHGTIDSARSSRAHHRPLIDLNDHDECGSPAKNGAFMHIPTQTPRVHGLTTPTHARRRAGHPLAGG